MKIAYDSLDKFNGWLGCPQAIEAIIREHNLKKICEIGAGCNPTLPLDVVQELGLDYTILDVSASELAKAPAGYNTWCADVTSGTFESRTGFDLIFSRMLLEHVENAKQMHQNIIKTLAPGGFAVHFFPTFYTFPFVLNRFLSDGISSALVDFFVYRDRDKHDKFKAYYRWCRGPTPGSIRRFQNLGFKIVEYRGVFGHGYYRRIPGLRELHRVKTAFLLKCPLPWFTSYATVLLEKPAVAG